MYDSLFRPLSPLMARPSYNDSAKSAEPPPLYPSPQSIVLLMVESVKNQIWCCVIITSAALRVHVQVPWLLSYSRTTRQILSRQNSAAPTGDPPKQLSDSRFWGSKKPSWRLMVPYGVKLAENCKLRCGFLSAKVV